MNHILILVSDPLDAPVSIRRDLVNLQDALRELEAAAVFDVRIAEADAVRRHLGGGDRPRYALLHYLGHGAKPTKPTDGVLIFEQADGDADELDATRLAVALAGADCKAAVLSACHSEHAAQALFAAGFEHVAAIEGDEAVYEVAAVAFSRGFYQALLTGRNFAAAFDAGRRALFTDEAMRSLGDRATQLEIAKFKLLSRPGCDPAAFRLPTVGGEAELRLLPALTAMPFDQQPAEFIGRERDMHDLLALLNRKRAAVVHGVSGVGKTELAKQTARRMVERRRVRAEHVGFASLVNVRTATEARAAIAKALGLKPDEITDDGALQRAVPPHRLLIVDEAENVIAGDGLAFRRLLDALIVAPVRPYVVVTSQTDPHTAKASPLPVRRLSESAAIRLFVVNADLTPEQAQRIDRADLSAVMEQVDRLPRAVELIARVWRYEREAQPESVDLTSLLVQLRADRDRVMRDPDYPAEVKSVSVGVQYAYDRLCARSPAAAQLWAQLALFPGGVSKAGLDAIFGAGATALAHEIERQSLVEFPFALFSAPFGDLLELPAPFRYFALRQLPAGDAAAARNAVGDAVLRYYFDFPDEPHRGWVGALDQACNQGGTATGALNLRFGAELPSVEAWLDWGYEHEAVRENRARAPRLTAWLTNLYVVTNELQNQRNRFDRALACALRCADKTGEANVLKALGDLHLRTADLNGARQAYDAALPIFREIKARLGEANVLQALGDLHLRTDDLNGARQAYDAALPIFREIKDRLGEANVLQALGDLHLRTADLNGARQAYDAALPIFREIKDRLGEANVLKALGDLHLRTDDLNGARQAYDAALPIFREIKARLGEANVLKALGDLHLRTADLNGARQAYDAALPIFREIKDRLGEANVLQALGDLHLRTADLNGARQAYDAALPIFREIKARLGEANVLQALGDLHLRTDDLNGARQAYDAALPIFREIKARLGEANVRLSKGNLAMAEAQPDDAIRHLLEAFGIQLELRDMLGVGAALGYLARVAAATESYPRAAVLCEYSLAVFRLIGDRFGQALTLRTQGEVLMALEEPGPALAAWWQARELFREIGDPSAERLDAIFEQFAGEAELMAMLHEHAEEMRLAGVAAARAVAGDDELLRAVAERLRQLERE